jgi:Ca-activated chloride channel homolog
MRAARASFFALAVLSFAAPPSSLAAQGWVIPRPCARPAGDVRIACPVGSPIVRTSSDVRVEMADRVLRYEISETFLNRGGTVGEADYVFPLPKNAAFQDLKLSINGELVSGETMGAEQARGIYEDIVRRQRDPALVEWMGYGMLRARIFPIAPGEEKRVVVRFQTVAEREGDALRIDYARGARPQAGPVPPIVTTEDIGVRRDGAPREPSNTFVLAYDRDDRLGTPYSPTHSLRVADRGGRRTVVALGDAAQLTILLPLRRSSEASISVLTHRPNREDGFALITITPPSAPARTTPRDVTFVVDVSGSMSGRKIEQARAAGRQLLETLAPTDRFRLIDFSTDVRTFRDDFVDATPANVAAARRYIDELRAEGSTNISGALTEALRVPPEGGRLPVMLFVTDGEPTVGERNPDAIAAGAARLRGRQRIFTFGVGADVNAALVERLALEGHGTAHFVRPEESVERAVALVASRLTSPVITDLQVRAVGNAQLRQVLPNGPVDVFAGQDLVLLARYDGSGTSRVRVEGRSPEGSVSWTQEVRFPERERDNAFVPRLWATQRIGYLAAERRKSGGNAELDGEIRDLGLRYGIPTELSSYLVVEPGMQVARRDQVGQRLSDAAVTGATGAVANSREVELRRGRQRGGVAGADTAAAPVYAPAPMAAAPSAVDKFEAAKKSADQRSTRSLAEADEAAKLDGATRRVGNRVFSLVGGVWTDAGLKPGTRTITITAYSPAYFDLVTRIDELKQVFALGDQVVVAGRAVAVRIGPDGSERLTPAELSAVERDW